MSGVGRSVFDYEVEEKRILSAVVGICVFYVSDDWRGSAGI